MSRTERLLPLLVALALAAPAAAQTKFSIFDQVGARGAGLTPAKGQLFYTSDTNGTIAPLAIGSTNDCLVVSGSGTPSWSNGCVGALSSVGLSMPGQFNLSNNPLTQNGTITITWATASANYVFAGPTSGGNGTPTFRQIVVADLPANSTSSAGIVATAPNDTAKFWRGDATWAVAPGTGTVSSVGLSMPGQFNVTNSPVTVTGTLTAAWNDQNMNKVFAGPASTGDGQPTFRAIVPNDLPVMTNTVKGIVPTPPNDATKALLGDGSWGTIAGQGTVTSAGLSMPDEFQVSGSPITGSSTITVSWGSPNNNHALMGAPGGVGFRAIAAADLPTMTATTQGIVPMPPNDSAQVLKGNGTWGTLAGTGTVTSVGLSVPAGFQVANSPVTTSGTLALDFYETTATRILATDGAGAVAWRTLGSGSGYINIFQPSGAGHAVGLVPDTPSQAGTSKFLREDSSWSLPPQGTVTSVDFSAPNEISVSGVPITASGTIAIGWNSATTNYVFAGPASGGANTPSFRALVADDYPTFIASGTNHKKGAVPDPGVTQGTTKFLREDATWQTPTFSSSIEVKELDGSPDVTGVSVLRFDQATGFTITDNGSGTATVACTSCGSMGGATVARQDQFTGDGSTTIFTLSAAPATNGIVYVALNGLPQPTDLWTPSGSNVTMDTAPIDGALLAVGYFTALPGTVTHTQEDFTGAGSTDFTLGHTPATNGVLVVALRGLIQPQTSWSLVNSTTLRFASAVPTGDSVTISYNY